MTLATNHVYSLPVQLGAPDGVWIDGGSLYLSEQTATLAGSGATGLGDGSGSGAQFSAPWGLAYAAGVLVVGDSGNSALRRVTVPAGDVSTTFRGASGSIAVFDVAAHALDAWLVDQRSSRIDAAIGGGAVLLAGSGATSGSDGVGAAASFNTLGAIATDGHGLLYVADTGNHTIRKIVIASGTVSTLAGVAGSPGSIDGVGVAARFHAPEGLALDGLGMLFVADTQNDAVRALDLASGQMTTVLGVPGKAGVQLGASASLNQPHSVMVLATGELLIVDETSVLIWR
jgi:hypothetical protein